MPGPTEPRSDGSVVSLLGGLAADPLGSLRRGGAWLLWYLKEIMGENAYIHYCESYERRHGNLEGAMEEKQFWRDLTDEQDRNPKVRCC